MSQPLPSLPRAVPTPEVYYPRPPRAWPAWVPALFLGLTVLSTLFSGLLFSLDHLQLEVDGFTSLILGVLADPALLVHGAPFCLALLGILLAHELGHYLTCRYYGIECTLPYVLPAPSVIPLPPAVMVLLGSPTWQWGAMPFNPFGTFGAVIRIRAPFRNRRQLFDVGVGGPLAGFVVILPVLAAALAMSGEFEQLPEGGLIFGESLLFQAATALFYPGEDPNRILLHPIGWAAWFGMLATSLNLLPIGQLDGGHMVYALFGPRVHYWVSRATFVGLVGVGFITWPPFIGYALFGMLGLLLGRRHPPPMDTREAPGPLRVGVALAAVAILALTFIPVPVRPA